MSKQDLLKTQTCILKVNIPCVCQGCGSKVRKILQKVDGVYKTSIDVEQGKVTVTGNVGPGVLIKKLEKAGKHAELWNSQKGSNKKDKSKNSKQQFESPKNLDQVGNGTGGGNDKKGKQKGGKEQQKGQQQIAYQQLLQQMQGVKGLQVPSDMKQHKSVKFNLPNKGGGDEYGDFSGEDDLDDEFDEDDDEFSDDGYHHQKAAMPIMGNGRGKPAGNDKKGGGGGQKAKKGGGGGGGEKAKKKGGGGGGGGGIMSMIGRAIGGKTEGKDGHGGKKGGGGGKSKGGNQSQGGGGGGKKGGGGGFQEHLKGGGMGPMGHYQMGPQFPAAQAQHAPIMAINGGMGPANPYQQPHYMAMMMNHPAAVYDRPPPPGYGYGYAQPMPPPGPYHHPLGHMFSDENPSACSIM